MALHNTIGKIGEQIAAEYLEREEYEILESNWRYRRAEIDLIVRKEEVLIFVEVKTRSTRTGEDPVMAVDEEKKTLVSHAAAEYQFQINHEWEIRFDIIVVLLDHENSFSIQHYEDAFFPGL